MAYMWRYNPAIAEMIRLCKAGALGDLFYFRGHIPKPMGYHVRLVEELDRYKGSLYFEMAGHLVDIMVAFMGVPNQANATHASHYGDRKHVDNAVVVHQFDNGGLGTIDTASMHVESGRTRRIELYGTGGTAIHTPIGSNNLTLSLQRPFEHYDAGWQELTVPHASGTALAVDRTRVLYSRREGTGLYPRARYGGASHALRGVRDRGWFGYDRCPAFGKKQLTETALSLYFTFRRRGVEQSGSSLGS